MILMLLMSIDSYAMQYDVIWCIDGWITQSNRIEQHVGTFGQPFVTPQGLKQVVLSLADLVIIEHKPFLPYPDVAHIMAIVLPRPQMHNHPH